MGGTLPLCSFSGTPSFEICSLNQKLADYEIQLRPLGVKQGSARRAMERIGISGQFREHGSPLARSP
jgi:hypothetical protein